MFDAIRIRPPTDADKRLITQLWGHAFPGERTIEERVRSLEDGKPYGGLEIIFAGELHSYRFRPEALPLDDNSLHLSMATPADDEGIAACYDGVARAANGPILRSPYAWKAMFLDGATHSIVFDQGGI